MSVFSFSNMSLKLHPVKLAALSLLGVATLGAEVALAGGASGFPVTYSVICRGAEGRAILNLNAPLKPGQNMVSESAFQNAVLHLTDARELRDLESRSLVVNTGRSNEPLHRSIGTPIELRSHHLSLIVDNGRVRYIGGGATEFVAGATLAVEAHHRSPVVLGINEASRALQPKMQIDVRSRLSEVGMNLSLQFSAYTPEIRRCTLTELVPNPWASLSPTVPAMMEVCAEDELVTRESVAPAHDAQMTLTACENFAF